MDMVVVYVVCYIFMIPKKTPHIFVTKTKVANSYPLTIHCFSQCKKLEVQWTCKKKLKK